MVVAHKSRIFNKSVMSLEISYLKPPISSNVFELTVKIWGVNWLK